MRRPDALVGRQAELAVLRALFEDDARVVAITGAIGVGKSRLAREVVAGLLDAGVIPRIVWVDALQATSRGELGDAIAAALDVRPDVVDGVARAIDALGDVLLVLDGLDGIQDVDAALDAWLEAAPAVRILLTRRARSTSSASSGASVPLEPLAPPVGDELVGPAADLLLQCVRRTRGTYEPTRAECGFLATLLRELDGLPLAIELAAPRLEVMSPAALLHRLRSGAAPLSSKARSLETALAGAWQSLPPIEREALTVLGAFAGGFTLEAAEEVVLLPDVVAIVESLRARSLLEAHTRDGEVRLSVLRTLREFIARHGDVSVRAAATERHARYFADRAEQWHRAQRGPDPATARRALAHDRENLLAVVESVLDAGPIDKRRAEPALRALVALFPAAGEAPPARYLAILRPTMDATQDSGADPMLVARAHLVAGAAYRAGGDRPAATRELTRALHIATTLAVSALEGEALIELARLLDDAGELVQAHQHAVDALRRFVVSGLRAEEAEALVVLAALSRARGEVDVAQASIERAIVFFDGAHDPVGVVRATREQARLLLDLGRHDALAAALASAAASITTETERLGIALLHAWSRHDVGDLEGAETAYEEIDERARSAGLAELEALVLGSKAAIAMERREVARAHALLRAARAATGARRSRSMAIFSALASVLDVVLDPDLARETSEATHTSESDAIAKAVRRLVDAPTTWPAVEAELRRLGALAFFARLALRALGPDARTRVEAKLPADALVIGAGGRWFRVPGGAVVDLERRKPLARILARLADARASQPDVLVSREELERVGWPGERIAPAAAAHRVRVAISTMRKVGLAGALLTREDGYLLDASCRMLRDG